MVCVEGELVILQWEERRQVCVCFLIVLKSIDVYFREPMGVVILEGCTVELAEEETDYHAFKVVRWQNNRNYITTILWLKNIHYLQL